MAAAKTTKPEDPGYDFDSWNQEAEDAALAVLNDVKYIIVEQDFVGRFADGTIIRVPLTLKLSLVEELQAKHNNQIDQFKSLVQTFAGDELAGAMDSKGLIPVAIMTEKYFRCLARAQELAFPESSASSS